MALQGLASDLGSEDLGLSFPARHEQVEQDRAPDVLPHHQELARPAAALAGHRGELDRHTTTKAGLRIEAELDANAYRKGIKVSDEELAAIQLEKASFHGEWNYTITPKLYTVSSSYFFQRVRERSRLNAGSLRSARLGGRSLGSQ